MPVILGCSAYPTDMMMHRAAELNGGDEDTKESSLNSAVKTVMKFKDGTDK